MSSSSAIVADAALCHVSRGGNSPDCLDSSLVLAELPSRALTAVTEEEDDTRPSVLSPPCLDISSQPPASVISRDKLEDAKLESAKQENRRTNSSVSSKKDMFQSKGTFKGLQGTMHLANLNDEEPVGEGRQVRRTESFVKHMKNAMHSKGTFKGTRGSFRGTFKGSSRNMLDFNSSLSDIDIWKIAQRQASMIEGSDEEDDASQDETFSRANSEFGRTSSTRSFKELPSVSRKHIVFVVLATVVSAPSVYLAAHVSTRTCWDAETSEEGLADCGAEQRGKFLKPWFLCWSSYVGQVLCLLLAWHNQRRARSEQLDSGGSVSSLWSLASTRESAPTETKRMPLCGCCCGFQIFADPREAAEEGIRVKPCQHRHADAVISLVPTFSDREGSPLRYKSLPWAQQVGFALFPGAMDLATTALQFMSLFYIPPSLTVMLKSLSIVWVTLFSRCLLPGRKVTRYQAAAVVIAMCGAGLITASALMQEAAETSAAESGGGADGAERPPVVLGIIFAVLAGLCAALGSLTMEKMMVELEVDASTLVGVMGVIGFVASALLLGVFHLLPGSDPGADGKMEDLGHTVEMLQGNWGLMTLMVLYATVGSGLNNWTIGEATRILSGVTMLLLRNLCTFLLWGVELALFYGVAGDRLGSALFLGPGLVKLAGFLTMSGALSVYLGFVKLPCSCLYPEDADGARAEDEEQPPPCALWDSSRTDLTSLEAGGSPPSSNSMQADSASSGRKSLRRANAMRVNHSAVLATKRRKAQVEATRRYSLAVL